MTNVKKRPIKSKKAAHKTKNTQQQTKVATVQSATAEKNSNNLVQTATKPTKQPKRNRKGALKILPGRRIIVHATRLLLKDKKVVFGVLAIFGIVQLVLVRGLIASDFTSLASAFDELTAGGWGEFVGGIALLAYLVGAGGQNIPVEGSVYLSIMTLIGTLAIIWALRHIYADKKIRIRDAFYKGMQPFIPYILVVVVGLLQLLPLIIGLWIYQVLIYGGIAVTIIEQIIAILILGLFAAATFYMLMSTIVALYIVTIPDMEPVKALRSAGTLVRHRRLQIFWRVLLLGIFIAVVTTVIMLPVIIVVPALAPWLFYILSVISLAYAHSYLYVMYRELLREA